MKPKFLVAAMAAVLLAQTGWADVTIASSVSYGGSGIGGVQSDQTEMISGRQSRIEHQSRKAGDAVKGMPVDVDHTIVLTLLDKDVIDYLNVPQKTYTEQSIKELRELFKQATGNAPEADRNTTTESGEPPTHRITNVEFDIKATSASKTLNGFPCRQHVMTMRLATEELKTRQKGETRMISTLWVTPETGVLQQVRKDQAAFGEAYRKMLGIEFKPGDISEFGTAMAAALTGAGDEDLTKAMKRIPAEIKKLQGFPILTQVEWSKSGKPLLSVITEVKSVTASPIAASQFAVPAGFKKIDTDKN